MPPWPCGVRARVYPDPAVLGAGLGENIVSITLLQREHVTDTMEHQQLLYAGERVGSGDQHIHIHRGSPGRVLHECHVSRAEKYVYNQVSQERS